MVGQLHILALLAVVEALRSFLGVDLVDIAALDLDWLLLLSCSCMTYFEHIVKAVVEVFVIGLSDQVFPRYPLSILPLIGLSASDSARVRVMTQPQILDREFAIILQSLEQVGLL